MRADGAAAKLARQVDGDVDLLAAMAADGSRFDRHEVGRIARRWEEYTPGFFRMLGLRPKPARDLRAGSILKRMAAGDPLTRPYRDFRGLVQPGVLALDPAAIDENYELSRATLRGLTAERTGESLTGHVVLVVPRKYAEGDALIHLTVRGLRTVWFDSGDAAGAEVRRDGDDVVVRVGADGLLRGATGTMFFTDVQWHLSPAGRAADAVTPRRKPRADEDIPDEWSAGGVWHAASAFREAMRRIAKARNAVDVGRVPLADLCEALREAGSRALAAADLPWDDRPGAFRALVERWSSAGPDGPEPAGALPGGVRLTLVSYETETATLTANFLGPRGARPAAAVVPWPGRALLSNAGDELTVAGAS